MTATDKTDKRKVVLILGAGAGFDLNMPLGSDLQKAIYEYCRFHFDELNNRIKIHDPPIRRAIDGKTAT